MFARQQKREDLDIVLKILEAMMEHLPKSEFVKSLHYQYLERGSLSKKQLQGLHSKAIQLGKLPPNWLVTLEAIINKMHTREKSAATIIKPVFEKDETIGQMLAAVLKKIPQHRQALLLQSKYDLDEIISDRERKDLEGFYRLAQKK